ncbi:hypothetical protein D9611_000135 [Ephemerocybe angulata]|uniref:NAD(+) kinase n=1 Tax=Ephemerocybe angulata TaxID=980116 RepID=A0A8H5BNH4_9AGAR|nr:hypothetical protein D9611_000135 [Tulosesus angulatus]
MPSSSLRNVLSDDTETFSTPPSTPAAWGALNGTHNKDPQILPSLSRKSSRPTSLHIERSQPEYKLNIELETASPPPPDQNGSSLNAPLSLKPQPMSQEMAALRKTPTAHAQSVAHSPCFVHSHLDKSAGLNWLKQKAGLPIGDVGVAKSLQQPQQDGPVSPESFSSSWASSSIYNNNEEEYLSSLTTRLAETAVSVREISKQLGRARVQSNIQNILIVTKARDNRLIKLTRELALYLMLKRRPGQSRGLVVYVDAQLRTSRRFDAEGIRKDHPELFEPFPRRRSSSHSQSSAGSDPVDEDDGQLRYWTSSMCSRSPHLFDFVVTLGGDGTVLFTSWLFQKVVPPVLPFALGSLGFLTNFDFLDHQKVMDSVIDNGVRVNLRMRFTCTVYRAVANEKGKGRKAVRKGETGEIIMKNLENGGGWEAIEGGFTVGEGKCGGKDKEIMCYTTRPVESFEVLNDLVVDRGPSPYVSLLELFADEHHLTTVQADGLTISTPTGSTAYSLSAGGSLVHPEIPAILVTPICPHTLSFRPILLPDSMELRICVPYNSRSTAWASFDGRGRVELKQGDHIRVTASKYPFPTVCADKQSTDWFHAISRTLKWNERERQKSFVVVEEEPSKIKNRKRRTGAATELPVPGEEENLDEEEEDEVSDEEEEEDDKFDIDDSSATESDATTNGTNVSEEREHLRPPSLPPKDAKKRRAKSRSKSRPRSTSTASQHSGVDSPGRYASVGPHNHKHVDFNYPLSGHSSPSSDEGVPHAGQQGFRDEIHLQKSPGGKNRVPREVGVETPRTATAPFITGRGRGQSVSRSTEAPRRAFAVWGQDESDSAASDSDR